MARDVVRFNGHPVEVTLKYGTGKECQNGSYLYTTEDDRAIFATAALNDLIQGYRPRAGERLQIRLAANNRWEVKPVDPAPAQGDGRAGNAAAVEHANTTNGHGNGNTGPTPAPPALMTGQSQFILQQLIAAIEAVAAAEKYSKAMGRPVEFTSEDIRAFAISCFIQQARGNGHV